MTLGRPDLLLEAARAGDSDAFAELLRPHLGRAATVAAAVTGSRDDGADAVQTALVGAWRGLRSIRDANAFGAWFHRLVVRAALKQAERRRTRSVRLVARVTTPDEASTVAERLSLVQAFAELSAGDRSIVALRYVLGYGIEETAAALGIPIGTAKSRSHYALQRMRDAYDPAGDLR